jgi:pyridoxamine 5'-phosphate oxidase-like protein
MDQQEVARELADPVARDLLEGGAMARLAYNGPDGLPRVVPVGFWWNGEQVVVCTGTTAPKVRALAQRPDVALTIDRGDTPGGARALLIRGTATVDIVDGVADEYLAMSTKGMADTLGEEGLAEFERQVRKTYEQMARIRVQPTWARCYDFGAGRLPEYLAELVARSNQGG